MHFHLNDNFPALVINFSEEKVQYLDNRKYDDDEKGAYW